MNNIIGKKIRYNNTGLDYNDKSRQEEGIVLDKYRGIITVKDQTVLINTSTNKIFKDDVLVHIPIDYYLIQFDNGYITAKSVDSIIITRILNIE